MRLGPPRVPCQWDWGDGAFVDDDAKKCTVRTGAQRNRLQAKVCGCGVGLAVGWVDHEVSWVGWVGLVDDSNSRMSLQLVGLLASLLSRGAVTSLKLHNATGSRGYFKQ